MSKDKSDKNWFARHKILSVILAFIAIAVIASAGSGTKTNNSGSDTAKKNTTTENKAPQLARVGEPARDSKFEFTVTKFSCGETTVGTNQYLQKTAQGQYCRMSLTIKNVGDKAQSLFSGDQKLVDNQNKQYSADDQATFYAAPQGSSSTWYNDINPGNTVTGDIIFDVPKDVTPVTAELHDSAFSGGVKISLQ